MKTSRSSSAAITRSDPEAAIAEEDAYYFERKLRIVAFVGQQVRLPQRGKWIRLASATCPTWLVEELLAKVFPELKGGVLRLETLKDESSVADLERSLRPSTWIK